VGSILALASVTGALAMSNGVPVALGVATGALAGLAAGLLNGVLTTTLRINPFIVTLGTLLIARGFALIITGGQPVYGLPRSLAFLGEGSLGPLPFVLWILIACAIAVHFLLEHTKLGRYAFAIGSNVEAAIYAGIPVRAYTAAIYAGCGFLTGLAGMIEASRLNSAQPTAGQGYELPAIAAVVIGGASLRGGEGGVVGTLIGAFIMGLLSNGCDLLGIQPFVQQAIIGAVIILAVAVDEFRKRQAV
jgi:ribose transport system permease protein